MTKQLKITLVLLTIFYIFGIVGHMIPSLLPLMLSFTPFVLLFFALFIVIPLVGQDQNFLLWFMVTYIATFILEVLGVMTGKIFGPYTYGATLGFKVWEVPLIIGINWVLVVLGAIHISERIFKSTALVVLTTGLFATLFDLFMEPVAIAFDYWTWHWSDIPPQNYTTWFITSCVAAFFYRTLKITIDDIRPMWYFAIQFLFFIVLFLVV